MDGSLFSAILQHPFVSALCLLIAGACGWSLYRHTLNCKASRLALYTKLDEVKDSVSELSSRISGLEAISNASHMQEIAALVAAIKDKQE